MISRRKFLALLGLAPAAALLPKVTLPEAPAVDPATVRTLNDGAASLRAMEDQAAAHGLVSMTREMVEDSAPTLYLGEFTNRTGAVVNCTATWDGKTLRFRKTRPAH